MLCQSKSGIINAYRLFYAAWFISHAKFFLKKGKPIDVIHSSIKMQGD
jgi:hypothetical protein